VAPVSALLATSPASNERIDSDIDAVVHMPAEDAGVAYHDGEGDERRAPQIQVVAPLGQEPAAAEEASFAVRQPAPETDVTAASLSEASPTQHVEAVAGEPRTAVLQIDCGEQQLDPPVQALGATTSVDQAAEAPVALKDESPAPQPLPDANDDEPHRAANLAEPRRDAVATEDERAPAPAECIGQQLEQSNQTADEPEEARVAVEETTAGDHAGSVINMPEVAATTATAAEALAEAPAATPQSAGAAATRPFDPSFALVVLDSQSPAPVQSEAAAQAEGELDTIALAVLSVARVDAPEPVVVAQVEATVQASPPNPEAAVPSEQQAIVQADEAAALAEADVPALDTGSLAADQERESATGRVDELQPDEQDDAAQLQHPAQSANGTTEESPGAVDDLDALFRDALSRPARQAVHRDRRGRQTSLLQPGAERKRAKRQSNLLQPPAEARLRLMLHPIRRTVRLALILLRPTEFPEQVTLELSGSQTVDALEEGQYGDVDLTWDADLLLNEIRVSCTEGYQWVRGARPVHIFTADPAQADLVSVSAATAGTEHTIICREQDADTVCDIAESAGSARPAALRRFSGMPDGWVVLSGYRPTRAAALRPAPAFSPLDPGHGIEITLQGGLEIGRRLYAQGRPPRIRIEPILAGISVHIGGVAAAVSGEGNWEAPGWDAPGQHRVEVIPGPSLNYEVQADPGVQGGWAFWDAHGGRTAVDEGPWSRAQICGALLAGPSGERVIAAELQPTILALGIDGSVGALRPRAGAGVSVGFAAGIPAFLLMSSGRRRRQGKIVWLGLPPSSEVVARPRRLSQLWIEAIRSAAARRLAMQADEEGTGQSIWQKAVLLARSAKRQRHG
jgi:hypothetical protein